MARESNPNGTNNDTFSQLDQTGRAIFSKFVFATRFKNLTELFVPGRRKNLDVLHNGNLRGFKEVLRHSTAKSLRYVNDAFAELKAGIAAMNGESRRIFSEHFSSEPTPEVVGKVLDNTRLIKQGLESRNLTVKLSDHIDLKHPTLPDDDPKPYHYHKPGYMFAFGGGQELFFHRKTGEFLDQNGNAVNILPSELDCPPTYSVLGRNDYVARKDQPDPKVTIRLNAEADYQSLDTIIPHEVAHGVAGLNDHFPGESPSDRLTMNQAIHDADTYAQYFRALSQSKVRSGGTGGNARPANADANAQRQFRDRDRSDDRER